MPGCSRGRSKYGAAHYRPERFQVFLEKQSRPIKCGAVEVAFLVRKRLEEVRFRPLIRGARHDYGLDCGATALDLVGFQHHVGGLSQVTTVLVELAEKINDEKLAVVAAAAPVAWSRGSPNPNGGQQIEPWSR